MKLARLAFLDPIAARRVPVLRCCPLCEEPFRNVSSAIDGLSCACSEEDGSCETPRVDFEREGAVLKVEDLELLGERYGVLDGRPRSVAEVARARRTTRAVIRAREAEALRRLLAIPSVAALVSVARRGA